MQFFRIGTCLCMIALIIITPIMEAAEMNMKEIVEKNKKNAKAGRWEVVLSFIMIIAAGSLIRLFPTSMNEVYDMHQGVIIECEKHEYGRTLQDFNCYIVEYVDLVTQEVKELDSLISKHAEEGDRIEIRKYNGYGLPVKINGVETNYEKEGPYVWGSVAIDRSIMAAIVMIMGLIHFTQYIRNKKIRCITRKGVMFWKLWHYGINLFHLLLFACAWIPIQSLLIGYTVGYILWGLFCLGEISRYLYLLEKQGYVWGDGSKKRKKEEAIKEKKIKMKLEEEQIQKVYFQLLNDTRIKRYCEYKYNKKKKSRNELLSVMEVFWMTVAFVVSIAIESQIKWLWLGVMGMLFLVTPVIVFRIFFKRNGWLKSAADAGGEYAVTIFEYYERRNCIFADGYKEICKIKFDDEAKAKDGTQVVLIRLKATNQIFTETMQTWNYISAPEIYEIKGK